MKNLKHPNFILAIVATIVLFMGVGMNGNGQDKGVYMLGLAALLAGIHWLWAIVDVISRHDLRPFQKRFWLIAVVAVPVFGALVFYGLHNEKDKIVT